VRIFAVTPCLYNADIPLGALDHPCYPSQACSPSPRLPSFLRRGTSPSAVLGEHQLLFVLFFLSVDLMDCVCFTPLWVTFLRPSFFSSCQRLTLDPWPSQVAELLAASSFFSVGSRHLYVSWGPRGLPSVFYSRENPPKPYKPGGAPVGFFFTESGHKHPACRVPSFSPRFTVRIPTLIPSFRLCSISRRWQRAEKSFFFNRFFFSFSPVFRTG